MEENITMYWAVIKKFSILDDTLRDDSTEAVLEEDHYGFDRRGETVFLKVN